jgi:SAM-dependent methyltransferase
MKNLKRRIASWIAGREIAKKRAASLEASVAVVMQPWAKSSYYADAEQEGWTSPFWDETSQFRPLFNRLDLTSVVELACGYGRYAERVAAICGRLTLVDVFQENLDMCAARLKGFPNVQYLKGNGHSFAGIPDASTTAIFCYDAMVHFSPDIVQAYLQDAARILRSGGRMLLHHSNYNAPTDQHYQLNPHARNHMTQKLFAELSAEARLLIEEQVIITWVTDQGLDAISLLRKP